MSEHESYLSSMAQLKCSLLHIVSLRPTVKDCGKPTSAPSPRVYVYMCALFSLAPNYKTLHFTSPCFALTLSLLPFIYPQLL